MATIVVSKKSNQRYIFLGSGFGAYQSKKPNWFFGDMAPDIEEGEYAMICVCNGEGEIGWMNSDDVQVESIDGQKVDTIL